MNCDWCDHPFKDGDEVTVEQPGVLIDGEFRPTEEASIHHDECPE